MVLRYYRTNRLSASSFHLSKRVELHGAVLLVSDHGFECGKGLKSPSRDQNTGQWVKMFCIMCWLYGYESDVGLQRPRCQLEP